MHHEFQAEVQRLLNAAGVTRTSISKAERALETLLVLFQKSELDPCQLPREAVVHFSGEAEELGMDLGEVMQGRVWAGKVSDLAALLNCHRNAVARALASLVKAKVLCRASRGKKGVVLALLLDQGRRGRARAPKPSSATAGPSVETREPGPVESRDSEPSDLDRAVEQRVHERRRDIRLKKQAEVRNWNRWKAAVREGLAGDPREVRKILVRADDPESDHNWQQECEAREADARPLNLLEGLPERDRVRIAREVNRRLAGFSGEDHAREWKRVFEEVLREEETRIEISRKLESGELVEVVEEELHVTHAFMDWYLRLPTGVQALCDEGLGLFRDALVSEASTTRMLLLPPPELGGLPRLLLEPKEEEEQGPVLFRLGMTRADDEEPVAQGPFPVARLEDSGANGLCHPDEVAWVERKVSYHYPPTRQCRRHRH